MSEGEKLGDGAAVPGAGPRTVGQRLRAAREAQGLSAADIAARTRVTQRFLEAIEDGQLEALPSPTYASGFARAYARAVGMDQAEVGREIRAELATAAVGPRVHHFDEIADPARGPSRAVVIVASGLAVAVLVLAALWFSTGMFRGTGAARDAQAPSVAVAVPAAATSAPAPRPSPADKVVLTATDEVWLRVYDAANETLYIGTLTAGQAFAVPPGADAPKINVGRPDKLRVTVDGAAVLPLGDGSRPIKDVAVSAAALRARLVAPGGGGASPAPAASPTVSPTAAASPAAPAAG